MKNNILKYSVILLSVALASACIKETFPESSTQTAEQVAKSEDALKAQANALPVQMMRSAGILGSGSRHWDFGIPALHVATDFMLEDIATQGEPGYNHFGYWATNEYMGSEYVFAQGFWVGYYKWIKSCNDIISVVNPETATAEMLQYLGLAYAYRAYFYLDLARLYEPVSNGGVYTDVSRVANLTVPIVDETIDFEKAKNNPRATHEEMYTFIFSDLEKAAEYLKDVKSGYTTPTIWGVYGLFARAYMADGNYKEAARYAKMVIDQSGKSPLTQDQWEDPVNGFNNGAANNSWIWGLTVSSENFNNLLAFSAHLSGEAQWGYMTLTKLGINKELYNFINDKDFRKHSWLDPDFMSYYKYKLAGSAADQDAFLNGSDAKSLTPAVAYQAIKFRPAKGECNDYNVGNAADHCLMRIEEMHFIYAEALARDNDLPGAIKALNTIMKTRYTDGSYDCTGRASSQKGFLDELFLQKRVEFWGEGIMIYDYKRYGNKGIHRGYEGTNHAQVERLNTAERFNSDGTPSPQWNLVVTRSEFQNNLGITDVTNNPDPSGTIKLWK